MIQTINFLGNRIECPSLLKNFQVDDLLKDKLSTSGLSVLDGKVVYVQGYTIGEFADTDIETQDFIVDFEEGNVEDNEFIDFMQQMAPPRFKKSTAFVNGFFESFRFVGYYWDLEDLFDELTTDDFTICHGVIDFMNENQSITDRHSKDLLIKLIDKLF